MKITLLIMAAGIGSRFGTGIKQLAKVDQNDHIIMDYSIHDAIAAGFNKIVFVIRKDIREEFVEVIGRRIENTCSKLGVEVAYVFQNLEDIPGEMPEGRTKPWGTGQAVLAAKEVIHEPFAIINADDYYGKEAFKLVGEHLKKGLQESCMAGFVLKNTMSDHGSVTRGVCKMEDGYLAEIIETHDIVKTKHGPQANGVNIDQESLVSMNMWGLTPDFMEILQKGFEDFFGKQVSKNPLKCEYLIPTFIGSLLEKEKISVRVLKTDDNWYGMTYLEDVEPVKESFRQMIAEGTYSKDLYSDL